MTEPVADGREAAAAALVIIVKKTQGSVWRECGRTELCPTAAWLHEHYGPGEYELRLKLGARILTMLKVLARREGDAAGTVEEQPTSGMRGRVAPRGLGTAPEPRTPERPAPERPAPERFGRPGYAYRKLA